MNSPSDPPPLPGTSDAARPAQAAAGADRSHDGDPRGPALRARFDGVIAGVRGDDDVVRRIVAEMAALGAGVPILEFDGGRYSVLTAAAPFDPRRAAPDLLRRYAELLGALAASGPNPRSATSTVRCVELFTDDVRETAFLVRDGAVHQPSRLRVATDEDRRALAAPARGVAEAVRRFGVARLAAVAVLVAALGFVVLRNADWRAGFSTPPVAALSVSTGAFGEAVVLEAEAEFPGYVVRLRRGPAYPRTREAAARLAAEADSPEARAAVAAVLEGGDVFVRLDAADGAVLRATRVSLRELLVAEDGVVRAPLGGHAEGARLRLSMAAGR